MIYMFLSKNPLSGDINSSNLPCLSMTFFGNQISKDFTNNSFFCCMFLRDYKPKNALGV